MERWVMGAGALAGVAGLTVAAAAGMAHFITRPRPLGHAPGSELGALIDDLRFRADDGVTLHGWYFGLPVPKAAIALGHGFGMTRADLVDLARALRDRGYAVLLFDFRAHGGSEGRRSSIGYHEARDMVAAARYLRARPELVGCRIGALGMSMGAAAALIAAAREPVIEAVVADSGFTSLESIVVGGLRVLYGLPAFPFAPLIVRFGEVLLGAQIETMRPVDSVARIAPRPLLIVHGELDRLIPVAEAHALQAASGGRAEIWIVPDSGHARAASKFSEEYLRRNSKAITIKEVRLKPKTDDHDLDTKTRKAREFLQDGDKVKLTVLFRGRENLHPEVGRALLDRMLDQLGPHAVIESPPRLEGRNMSAMLAPKKQPAPAAAAAPAREAQPRREAQPAAEQPAAVAQAPAAPPAEPEPAPRQADAQGDR